MKCLTKWDVTKEAQELVTAYPVIFERVYVVDIKKVKELIDLGYSMSVR